MAGVQEQPNQALLQSTVPVICRTLQICPYPDQIY